jgi:nucleoside-diphosphate-sugar epimerase
MIEPSRALVTGAGGCVGRCLVRRLVAEGCPVHALDIDGGALQRLVNAFPQGAVTPFCADLADADTLRRACDGVEVVFHAAAKVHSLPRNPREEAEFFAVNLGGTENLLQACSAGRLRSFVFFSTIAVYGTGEGSPLTEATSINPENSYAKSKLEAERRVREFFGQTGVRPIIFRMSLVYGEGERGNFSRMMRAVDSGRFLLIGDGATLKSMIYVEDVVSAALTAAWSPGAQAQVFILSDPQPYSLRDVVQTLARHLGVRPPRVHVPLWLARSGGAVLAVGGRILGIPAPFTALDVKKLATDTICDVSKIQAVLGFRSQYGLDEGVRRTVRWYREEQAYQRGTPR